MGGLGDIFPHNKGVNDNTLPADRVPLETAFLYIDRRNMIRRSCPLLFTFQPTL